MSNTSSNIFSRPFLVKFGLPFLIAVVITLILGLIFLVYNGSNKTRPERGLSQRSLVSEFWDRTILEVYGFEAKVPTSWRAELSEVIINPQRTNSLIAFSITHTSNKLKIYFGASYSKEQKERDFKYVNLEEIKELGQNGEGKRLGRFQDYQRKERYRTFVVDLADKYEQDLGYYTENTLFNQGLSGEITGNSFIYIYSDQPLIEGSEATKEMDNILLSLKKRPISWGFGQSKEVFEKYSLKLNFSELSIIKPFDLELSDDNPFGLKGDFYPLYAVCDGLINPVFGVYGNSMNLDCADKKNKVEYSNYLDQFIHQKQEVKIGQIIGLVKMDQNSQVSLDYKVLG
jgi:hypothetical protein